MTVWSVLMWEVFGKEKPCVKRTTALKAHITEILFSLLTLPRTGQSNTRRERWRTRRQAIDNGTVMHLSLNHPIHLFVNRRTRQYAKLRQWRIHANRWWQMCYHYRIHFCFHIAFPRLQCSLWCGVEFPSIVLTTVQQQTHTESTEGSKAIRDWTYPPLEIRNKNQVRVNETLHLNNVEPNEEQTLSAFAS